MSYGHLDALADCGSEHQPSSVPFFLDVMLRYSEPDSYRWHALAWVGSKYLLWYTSYC